MTPEQIAWILEAENRGEVSAEQAAWMADARKRKEIPPPLAETRRQERVDEIPAWNSALRGASQGATFGFLDELINLNPWAPGAGSRMRQANAEAREANPGAYFAGELGGGLVTGGGGAARVAGGQALKAAAPRLAAYGAGAGGVAGAGYSDADTLSGRAADAGIGAGVGGVVGGALPAAGAGLRGALRAINPDKAGGAARTIAADLEQAGLTPEKIRAMLAENPNLTVADLDPQLQQRLAQAAGRSTDVARDAQGQLIPRGEAQADRVTGAFRAGLGDDVPTREAIATARQETRDAAAQLYDDAYSTPITPTERMTAVLDTDFGKAALKQAQKRLRNKQQTRPDRVNYVYEDMRLARDADVRNPLATQGRPQSTPDLTNTQLWDEIGRTLGDRAYSLRNTNPSLSRDYGNLQRQVTDGINDQSDSFRAARSMWRSDKADDEARELAGKVFKGKTPDMAEAVGDMSTSEFASYRLGVFEEIQDMIGRKQDDAKLSRLFSVPKVREGVKLAFRDDDAFARFMSDVGNESAMERTLQMVMRKPLIEESTGIPGRLPMPNRGDWVTSLVDMARAPAARRHAEAIAPMLLGRDVPAAALRAGGGGVGNIIPAITGGASTLYRPDPRQRRPQQHGLLPQPSLLPPLLTTP